MDSTGSDITTRHDDARHRVEAVTDSDKVAGFVEYTRTAAGDLDVLHTEVDDAYEGQGVGSILAKAVLDVARTEGVRVRPTCPFLAQYMKKHIETHDLYAPDGP